jgi:hypothetical protein
MQTAALVAPNCSAGAVATTPQGGESLQLCIMRAAAMASSILWRVGAF